MSTTLSSVTAQDYGQAATIRLWDNATAPHSNGITAPESEPEPCRIVNTTTAELYIYPADPAKATGQAVVICPGGGYMKLCMDYEGYEAAQWLATNGITAAVLKYRLPNGHPEVPLEDAEQSLRLLRGDVPGAEAYACPKVGIMGFSAGGHLAAAVSTKGAVRPDFSLLFYPVTEDGALSGCQTTFDMLLGSQEDDAQTVAAWTPCKQVSETTPRALIFHSDDDTVVPSTNSTDYYEALKRHGIEASLHIYPTGGHGWGILDGFRYKSAWQETLLGWLKEIGK